MTNNKELELAWEFVNKTNRSIFLTGKAGTGKKNFFNHVKISYLNILVFVAPTGVAAINTKVLLFIRSFQSHLD